MTEETTAPQRERESSAAAERPTASTKGSTDGAGGDGPPSDGGSTSRPRRRRRGGRGRGGRGGGGATRATDATEASTAEVATDAPTGDGEAKKAPTRAPRKRSPQKRAPAAGAKSSEGDGDADAGTTRAKATTRRRTSTTRSRPAAEDTDAPEAKSDTSTTATPETSDGETPAAPKRRRRRGGRGRRRPGTTGTSGTGAVAGTDAAEEELPTAADRQREDALPDAGGEEPAPKRTRARRGGTKTKTATDEAEPAAERAPSTRRRRAEPAGRSRRRPATTRRRRDPPLLVHRRTDKRMIITEIGERDQIAVLEDRELVEHYVTRAGAKSMVGNIYVGRVQNVLPGMEAAFIDVGRGRNGVLYAGEVNYDEEVEEGSQRIEEVLKSGQGVLVQVTKDPMGGKGARLTAQISLPGRFLVFVPNQLVFGISRRLPDDERARLRDILKPIRPEGHGIIARTAAAGATAEDLQADLERLMREWDDVAKKSKRAKPAKLIYEEPELTVRVVRDLFTEEEFQELVTDSSVIFEKVRSYLASVAPDLVEKVHLYEGNLPLMEEYHVAEQIRKALERKVWLPSGGYLVVDRTEAMTVIDVNTGKHVGKTNLEETVTKTNLEAADEIARQLRLRDIGGIILCDFIDMLSSTNQRKVVKAMKEALARDRTRSQVFEISPLGLLEMTRKKVSAGLVEAFSETCPTCEGRGILLTHEI